MNKILEIKGVIFDYGGTIDTNSCHWAEVLWSSYKKNKIPVNYEDFREAYVFAERALAKFPYITPSHNFHDVLNIKVNLELQYLASQHIIDVDITELNHYARIVADDCYNFVLETLKVTAPVVKKLSEKYKVVLVSNFYGNIHTILKDFGLDSYFIDVIESSVVKVRKPDPAIFALGVKSLELPAQDVVVIGDSFSKDIVPASSIGCKTIWLEGKGWGNEIIDKTVPDAIVSSLEYIPNLLF